MCSCVGGPVIGDGKRPRGVASRVDDFVDFFVFVYASGSDGVGALAVMRSGA